MVFVHMGQYRRLSSGSSCKTYTPVTGPKRFSQEAILTHTRTGKVTTQHLWVFSGLFKVPGTPKQGTDVTGGTVPPVLRQSFPSFR